MPLVPPWWGDWNYSMSKKSTSTGKLVESLKFHSNRTEMSILGHVRGVCDPCVVHQEYISLLQGWRVIQTYSWLIAGKRKKKMEMKLIIMNHPMILTLRYFKTFSQTINFYLTSKLHSQCSWDTLKQWKTVLKNKICRRKNIFHTWQQVYFPLSEITRLVERLWDLHIF